MPETTQINIELPLPLDVVSTLTQLIGAAYPGAMMSNPTGQGFRSVVSFEIPAKDRVPDGELYDFLETFTPEFVDTAVGEAMMTMTGMGAPAFLAHIMRSATQQALADEPGAENYLEYSFAVPEENTDYLVTIARGQDRTPAALREQAERRADRYAEKLRELGVDPEDC